MCCSAATVTFIRSWMKSFATVPTISANELLAKIKTNAPLIIDVRSEGEFAVKHIQGAVNIPVNEIELNADSLDKKRDIVVYCRSGGRATIAYQKLAARGFNHVAIYPQSVDQWAITSDEHKINRSLI